MSVRYIVGRAGSGKTTAVLQDIRERLTEGEAEGPFVLLVPEQATFKAEHALVTMLPSGGFMRAQVLSFRRFAYRVMQEAGGAARIHIQDNGKKMLLRKLLHRSKAELREFHAAADQPGLIDKLSEMMTELKRYRIDAERLARHLADAGERGLGVALTNKLHDLHKLTAAYEKEIAGLYIDAEDDLALLAERFEHSSYAGRAEIWIDGFHGFTPQELAAVSSLMRHARRVHIAICADRLVHAGEKPDELDLFHPTASTLAALRELAAEAGVKEETPLVLGEHNLPRYERSPMLAELERALASDRLPEQRPAFLKEDICIVSAAHRRAEAEAAARRMAQLAREGSRWRDMAVLVRNMADYRDVLATTLTDYGIPHFFDQKKSVAHHPLLELIRAALETVIGGWRYDSVFRAAKSGLLVDEPTDELENYVLAFGIRGTRWTDAKPWTALPYRSLEEDEPDANAEYLERINRVRRKVAGPLQAFERRLKKAGSVREMAEAVYELMEMTGCAEKLEQASRQCMEEGRIERAKEHAGVWDGVVDALEQFVEMMGEETIELPLFAELLDTGFEHMKLGLVPPSLDQVLIGSMERARPGEVRHVFVLGASDGVLPSAMKEDGILSEAERARLEEDGLQLAPGSVRRLFDERFMIYTALALPSDSLWISYPLADDEGKAILPSYIVRHIERLFPQLKVRYEAGEPPVDSDDAQLAPYMLHPNAVLPLLALQLKRAQGGERIADSWWHAYNWFVSRPDLRGRLMARTRSLFYSNTERPIAADTGARLFGSPIRASVSRMELLASCRFAHYASYGLRLRERPVYRLEAPDVGQLFHAALSEIGAQLQAEGIRWGALTAEACAERAAAAVDRLAPRLQSEILLSSSRYRYIAAKLTSIVSKAAAALAEHSRRSAFTPIGFEIGFGGAGPLPPLRIPLEGGNAIEIIGRIDRIDAAQGKNGPILRIIDYKSSRTELNMAEVYHGLSLQMLTYLDVAVSHAKRLVKTEAAPGGMLYFHVHQPLIRAAKPLAPEEAEQELLKRYKMKGLILAEEETVKLMDTTLGSGYSAIVPVAVKADGSFYKNASVMTEHQWNLLRRHGRRMMRRAAGEIAAGKVDIAPVRIGSRTACDFCSFRPVCQFDPLENAYAVRLNYKQDEVWSKLESEGGSRT